MLPTRLLLNKLAFGPSPRDTGELERVGMDTWLSQQLNPGTDDGCDMRIAAIRFRLKYQKPAPLQQTAPMLPATAVNITPPGQNPQLTSTQSASVTPASSPPAMTAMVEVDEERSAGVIAEPIEQSWKLIEQNAPNQERAFLRTAVAAATLVRAVHSPWQLREIVVDFWHNHFNVNAVGDASIAIALPSYDRDAIRAHALGNFRLLLEAVAKSAAMQIYLNNRSSRGGAANENFARELFELHTLGRPAYFNALYNRWRDVPGSAQGRPIGYIDQDVYEAARAFTGWTIEDGAGIGAGLRLPQTGKFVYVEGFHDTYQKRVLATEFDPYQKPMADGHAVLDLVAEHPATALYVCGKLCRRLVSDAPSAALIAQVAKVFADHHKSPDQIARTIRAIVASQEFAVSSGAKIKRPLELMASYARAAQIDLTVTQGLLGLMDASGQRLYGWGPPTGHPDESDYWLNSAAVRKRWELVLGLANETWKTGAAAGAGVVAQEPTAATALDKAHRLILGGPAPQPEMAAILGGMGLEPQAVFASRKDAWALSRSMLAYCAMTSEFQKR